MHKITPCIWSDHAAEEQANFYATLLPDGRVTRIERTPVDTPSQKAGDVIIAEFELGGRAYVLLNGGPIFPQTEAVSFMIHTDDQAETDRLWDAIVGNGGTESQCGWCKDKWGLNWQITPRRMMQLIWENPDPAAARRAMQAMMQMRRIDIAAIESAAANG